MSLGGSARLPLAARSNLVRILQVSERAHCRGIFLLFARWMWRISSRELTDLQDYPSNTVPNKVAQLFTAQVFHDRKQRWTRHGAMSKGEKLGPAVDYLRPIVADADTGHGGEYLTS